MSHPGFIAIDRIAHRASIIAAVIDARSQAPLVGWTVQITDAPAAYKAWLAGLRSGRPGLQPDLQISDTAGCVRWLDLPAGTYTLTASAADPRYDQVTASATLTLAGPLAIQLAAPPSAITGIVKADNPAGPLAMVRVRLESGEQTYTATDGTYTLSPVEPGTDRAVAFSAQRYAAATIKVTVQRGKPTTATTITLIHS